jgi:muramoyltetrapeptide carboxypeptidase
MPPISMKPPALASGQAIGVCAPASPPPQEDLGRGLAVLASLGHPLKVSGTARATGGLFAGSDAERAKALTDLWDDPETGAIVCARGGYGSLRILPFLDLKAMAARPKIFAGFSDATALLIALSSQAGLVTFHGPVVTSLGPGTPEDAADLAAAFTCAAPVTLKAPRPVTLAPGRAEGKVLGGNLTTLCHLAGTPWQPDLDGCLLFLEDRGEAPYRIDRMLSHLRLAGVFNGVRGVALGSFTDCGRTEVLHPVLLDAFSKTGIPVCAGFPAGHGTENRTLPLGIPARLDAEAGTLRYLESALLP